MPYVEVWVDGGFLSDDELTLLRRLVSAAHVVADRYWPEDIARELYLAAMAVQRGILLEEEPHNKEHPADRKYKEWLKLHHAEDGP